MTEETVDGGGGQHEIVVRDLPAVDEMNFAGIAIDPRDFRPQDGRVAMSLQQDTAGCGDIGRRKRRRRDLMEQRLKGW